VRRYLAGRLLQAVIVVFLVTTVTFVLVHLAPGDPISAALDRPGVTDAIRQQQRVAFGLDRPIGEQYLLWVGNAMRGELGYSFSNHRPVREVIVETLPLTLLLVGLAMLLSFAIGIVVAVLQAERPQGRRDRWLGRVLLLVFSVPDFWLALVVLMLFAYQLHLLPPSGLVDPVMHEYLSPWGRFVDRLEHLVIAKGLSPRAALRRHALRNALLPTITLAGLNLSALAAGAVFVEKVFSWRGMGLITANAIGARDYPLITAGVLITSIFVALGTLLADVAAAVADPRIRVG
jgi:peptide/nickel transport system permease protein